MSLCGDRTVVLACCLSHSKLHKKILGGLISTPAEEVSIYGQFLQKRIKDFIVSVS